MITHARAFRRSRWAAIARAATTGLHWGWLVLRLTGRSELRQWGNLLCGVAWICSSVGTGRAGDILGRVLRQVGLFQWRGHDASAFVESHMGFDRITAIVLTFFNDRIKWHRRFWRSWHHSPHAGLPDPPFFLQVQRADLPAPAPSAERCLAVRIKDRDAADPVKLDIFRVIRINESGLLLSASVRSNDRLFPIWLGLSSH